MDRGQTAHDFALGMGVFLLTVAFAFSTLPTLTAPYESEITDVGNAHAARVAATTVEHLSVDGNPARLDRRGTSAFFRNRSSGSELRAFFGLPSRSPVNVTIRNGSGIVSVSGAAGSDTRLSAGDAVTGRPTATAVRTVSFSGGTTCRPACRLVVELG